MLPELLNMTVPQLLRMRAETNPNNIALSARSGNGWRDRLTYAQLVDRMDKMASGLMDCGLGRGDPIAVLLDNSAGRECILTSVGALKLGAPIVPLNTRYSDEELGHALALVEPKAVVTDIKQVERVQSLYDKAVILVIGDEVPTSESVMVWPDPQNEICAHQFDDPDDENLLGCLLFTSGTTARAKAVMHTHSTMIGAGLACGSAIGLNPGDLYHGGWPFFTSSGLNLGCMSSWVAGAGLVFEETLSNSGRLRLIESERSTVYHGVPSVIHFMIDEFPNEKYDVSSLRAVGYGGSAMPMEVIDRIAKYWPEVAQIQIYGMTESGPSGTVLQPENISKKHGSIGVSMPFCGLAILDEAGEEVETGETGEIFLSGPGISTGYYSNDVETKRAFINGGIRTGDVGHVDDEGFLYFTDRLKDIINRGGLKIASIAVEQVLYRHPSVGEAAVLAVPHSHLGEDVAACIVPAKNCDIDLKELAAFCGERLADYECPRRWVILEELPKSPMGKVLKTELSELLAD